MIHKWLFHQQLTCLLIIIAALLWAYPGGNLKDVTIVSTVILVTMLILIFGSGNQNSG
jgi:hypothetical protein